MKFILHGLVDSILRLVFGLLVVWTLVVTMMSIREALQRLSFQARSRLPFGVIALLLAVCALWYGHSLYGTFFTAMSTAWEAVSLLSMTKHLLLSYVLYSGFVLLVAPVLVLTDIWWSFHRASLRRTLSPDRRRPVLLLRSFEGDESDAGPSRDLERALSKAIGRKLGPLIALGSQADFNPPSGARRVYIDGADWQAKVMEFIEVATAIVFVVSKWTPSVRWEMEQVRARFKPERALLIVPPRTGYIHGQSVTFATDRQADLLSAVGIADAEWAGKAPGAAGAVLVGYQADWSPFVLQRDIRDVRALAEAAAESLLRSCGAAA